LNANRSLSSGQVETHETVPAMLIWCSRAALVSLNDQQYAGQKGQLSTAQPQASQRFGCTRNGQSEMVIKATAHDSTSPAPAEQRSRGLRMRPGARWDHIAIQFSPNHECCWKLAHSRQLHALLLPHHRRSARITSDRRLSANVSDRHMELEGTWTAKIP